MSPSPFPEAIKTRINGRKSKRFVHNGWVMLVAVDTGKPGLIWVHWIRKVGERRTAQVKPLDNT